VLRKFSKDELDAIAFCQVVDGSWMFVGGGRMEEGSE